VPPERLARSQAARVRHFSRRLAEAEAVACMADRRLAAARDELRPPWPSATGAAEGRRRGRGATDADHLAGVPRGP